LISDAKHDLIPLQHVGGLPYFTLHVFPFYKSLYAAYSRESLLTFLQTQFKNVSEGEGYCVCISGEAGIGKTALVKAFCKQQEDNCNIYFGLCDALFTPHPPAPLYDIII
jgi:hypothetical protein